MTVSYEDTRTYQINADVLFEYCISALMAQEAQIKKADGHTGRIKSKIAGKLGLFRSSRGFDIEIEVIPISSVEAKISMLIVILSEYGNRIIFGSNKQAEEKSHAIFSSLDEIVKRAQIKYGGVP